MNDGINKITPPVNCKAHFCSLFLCITTYMYYVHWQKFKKYSGTANRTTLDYKCKMTFISSCLYFSNSKLYIICVWLFGSFDLYLISPFFLHAWSYYFVLTWFWNKSFLVEINTHRVITKRTENATWLTISNPFLKYIEISRRKKEARSLHIVYLLI